MMEPTNEGTLAAVTDRLQAACVPRSVRATTVVHCTNGYCDLLPALTRSQVAGAKGAGWLVPVRNQVAVTAPLPGSHPLPRAAFYAHSGYVYFSRR
jgi:glycine/D-amino acid oxidase-like deaminating enzyme